MIDYVVPMVFPSDPLWRADLSQAQGYTYSERQGNAVRYRSWDTEELLTRCIRKFLPWVRHIIVLLARDSQRQPWMSEIPGLRIVLHHEFMPKECLPTFNSRAMEMFLHCIPGLSQRFLYANDDMFPLSPMTEEDFFIGNLPCQHHTEKPFPAQPNQFHRACLGGLNFVAREFGKTYSDTWLHGGHSIAPILQASCRHLWQRGAENIMRSVTPFRDQRNFNQYIYSWYQLLSDKFIDRTPKRQYLSVRQPVRDIVKAIEEHDSGILCINDNECRDDISLYAKAVRDAITRKLNEA